MLSEQGFNRSRIVNGVADYFGVSLKELRGRRRWRRLVVPRQVAAWLLRQDGMTYAEIGRRFNRDHSTMVHAVRVVADRMKEDDVFRAKVMKLWRELMAPLGIGEKGQESAADAEQAPEVHDG